MPLIKIGSTREGGAYVMDVFHLPVPPMLLPLQLDEQFINRISVAALVD